MSPKKATKQTTKSASSKPSKGFTDIEKAAMKARAAEIKAGAERTEGEKAVQERIAALPPADRALAKRIHAIVTANAPHLTPKLWYGFPAYAREGKIVCFFQDANKFKARYAELGFSDPAHLDDGHMWPVAYALTKDLSAADEARIAELVKKAAS
jgi:uncharacterized protein YdhG (YjbR/CyaY superfamily)